MKESNKIITGIFLSEIKNRFLCLVLINGKETACYIPSSCRLSNFINLNGKTVLLKPTKGKDTRTEYAVYAVKHGRGFMLLNLSEANKVVERQLHRRCFAFLGKRKNISHEIKIEDYKADLFIHDTSTIIEIKSILTTDNNTIFPSVHSERAILQLFKIKDLLDKKYKVCYMLVSMNPYINSIKLNETDKKFYDLFRKCIDKGMICIGLTVKLNENSPTIYKKLNVVVD